MELLLGLAVLFLLGGTVSGWMALSRIGQLRRQLNQLQRDVGELRAISASSLTSSLTSSPSPSPSPAQALVKAAEMDADTEIPVATDDSADLAGESSAEFTPEFAGSRAPNKNITDHLRANWMIWLGGACVAMAGVFLARYSIERGLLGPTARVVAGVMTGLVLYLGAELLRRRTGESNPAFAALAGGGSITLFAALLAALHFYQMLSHQTVFLLLAVVALATMMLAYVHGPVLAAIGIVGAYAVPLLVASEDGNTLFALGYSLVISASALLLLRYMYRSWLWWGFMAGAMLWLLLSLGASDADGARGWYLAVLGYFLLAIPHFDFTLRRVVSAPGEGYRQLLRLPVKGSMDDMLLSGLALLALGQGLSMLVEDTYSGAVLVWAPLVLVLFAGARRRELLSLLPWLLLLLECAALVIPRLVFGEGDVRIEVLEAAKQASLFWFLAWTAALYIILALVNLAGARFKAAWGSLAVLSLPLLLAVAYFLTARFLVSWQWGSLALMLGLAYMALAVGALRKASVESLGLWLFFGSHFGLALAAMMVLREASLTLVFALQVLSASWVVRRFKMPELGWLVKGLVMLVVCRLTLNPWLSGYPADVHWSLWTMGGATLCVYLAKRVLHVYPLLARWAEGATLHLFVLTLWAETRYALYDGYIFRQEFTATEAGLYLALFGSMALVYRARAMTSEHLKTLYLWYSRALMLGALASYGTVVLATLGSANWVWGDIGAMAVFNLMLLLYGVPVVLGALAWWMYDARFRSTCAVFTGAALFLFVSLEIRHLWQGSVRLDTAASSGELYTYSAVWLVMAVATMLLGSWRLGQQCYRAGLLLLGLVIAKLFLVDMSGLEGLLRVASFMGLGLSLLGISYLHQRIQRSAA